MIIRSGLALISCFSKHWLSMGTSARLSIRCFGSSKMNKKLPLCADGLQFTTWGQFSGRALAKQLTEIKLQALVHSILNMNIRPLIHLFHHWISELGPVKTLGKERSEIMKEQGQIKGQDLKKKEARTSGDRRKGRNKDNGGQGISMQAQKVAKNNMHKEKQIYLTHQCMRNWCTKKAVLRNPHTKASWKIPQLSQELLIWWRNCLLFVAGKWSAFTN